MIILVEGYNAHRYQDLMDQMFVLRARIFSQRLRWDVQVVDGRERDKYDDQDPAYLIYTDENAKHVKGSLRLMPTTGPTLLADIFHDTLPAAAQLSAPSIWECTRLCIDDRLLGGGSRDELLLASTALIAGLGEVAIAAGIEMVLGNFDASMLRLYRQIGCDVEVLGSTQRFGNSIYLGSFHVSRAIVNKLKRRQEFLESAISGTLQRPILAA